MNFYYFHLGDYKRDTSHLSWDEDMAYRRMMDAYYARETPLPADKKQIYRLISAQSAKHRAAVDAVLTEFFVQTNEGFKNNRCEEEITGTVTKREKAKASAKARWGDTEAMPKESDGNANASANAMRTHSDGNAPTPTPTPTPTPSSAATPDEFEKVDAALRKIPGIDKHPVYASPVIAPIWQMVVQGYDLKQQIIPSIKRQLANRTDQKPIKGWGFFVPGIVEDNSKSAAIPVVDDAKWKSRLATARSRQQWDPKWGPLPNKAGCLIPAHLLQPSDGLNWHEWRVVA